MLLFSACMYSPCVLHLCNIHALGKDRDGNNEGKSLHCLNMCSYILHCHSYCVLLLLSILNVIHKTLRLIGLVLYFQTDSRVSSYFHECIENVLHKESPDWPVIVLATTSNLNSLTRDMHAGFLHTFEIEVCKQIFS